MTANSHQLPDDLAGSAWDVVVVGAGPAGAMAAHEIARRGATVLLVDKAIFPRYKVCGCCLNGRALSTLGHAELGEVVESLGGEALDSFELAVAGRSARMKLPRGMAVSRGALDYALAKSAVQSGARFVPDCKATLEEGTASGWIVSLQRGDDSAKVEARIVLAADGLGQKLLNSVETFESPPVESAHIGAGVMLDDVQGLYKAGTIYMAVGEGGYVGLVRVEDNRLNIAAALNPSDVRHEGGPGALTARLLDEAGLEVPQGLAEADWRGTPPLTRRASRMSAHRFLVLGDAAGYVEPFTGEGMAWALSAGRAVAPIACKSIDCFDRDVEAAWAREHRSLSRVARIRCGMIAAGLRRPKLMKAATQVLRQIPALAYPVIGRMNAASPPERKSLR